MNQKLINKPIITSEDLEQLGIPPTQAKRVVHDAKKKAADDFLAYVTSDDAKKIFDSYYFDTNVE